MHGEVIYGVDDSSALANDMVLSDLKLPHNWMEIKIPEALIYPQNKIM